MTTNSKIVTPVYVQNLGAIRAAVWESKFDTGRSGFNITITRVSKETKSGEWTESSTFNGLAELALVREAARLAANWIEAREREAEARLAAPLKR